MPKIVTPLRIADDNLSNADLAAAVRRKVSDLAQMMEVARLRGVDVTFQIRKDVNGHFKVTELNISKIESF